jgi:NAD(P)-dependent dehydrogenase (short-subunit alcohol dehydrogenase family)
MAGILGELQGKTAVITGGASGIGLAMAQRFGAEGMNVVIADVEQGALNEASDALIDAGITCAAMRCDVSDLASVEALADFAYSEFGNVHILCNNAGVVHRDRVWEASIESWNWVLGVDLWGPIYGVKTFVPRMIASGEPGHVINTASTAGILAFPGIASYDVAKQGVVALSEALLVDARNAGVAIRSSVLCPGVVRTKIGMSERNRPDNVQGAAFGTQGLTTATEAIDPEDVADHVLRAVREGSFWIMTHPRYVGLAQERAKGMETGAEPPVPSPI